MTAVAWGLAIGLVVGAVNQVVLWLVVRRARPGRAAGLVAGFLGGCAVRLGLDALALYAAWRLTRDVWAIVASAGGVTVALGAGAAWQFVQAQRRRGAARGGGGRP